jgi:hypothetical protein
MTRKILRWLTHDLPMREIDGDDGRPYLERYFVCRQLGWQVYIHRFIDSDPARGLHNHPWERAISLILAGGYTELRSEFPHYAEFSRELRPLRLNFISGSDRHQVLLKPGVDCWSLFVHGPYVQPWGFFRRGSDGTVFRPRLNSHREWWMTARSRRERETLQWQK